MNAVDGPVGESFLDDLDFDLVELGSSNSVHDRTQFESKFDFDLTLLDEGKGSKVYEVDLYLFFPQSLGINQESYSTDNFYADLTHLLRVRTPEPRRPAKEGSPERQGGGGLFEIPPLNSVDEYFLAHLDTGRRQALQQLVVHEVKLFGCLIYTELKKLQTDLVKVLKRARHTHRDDLVGRFRGRLMRRVENIHREIRNYREHYIWRMETEPLLLDDSVKRALVLVDEYLSYRLEACLVNMHRMLHGHREMMEDLLLQIEALLTGELSYRGDHIQGAAGHEEGRNERRQYRLGLLKKYVSEVLFLETRRLKKDYVYRNFIAAFGAALAAAFATIANIQTVQMVTGQEDMGLRLFSILALGVIAYVFKDRIKDLSKDYFNARLKTWLPDFDVQMFYSHFDPQGRQTSTYLGSSQEYSRYLDRTVVPPDVNYIRELGHQRGVEPERLESVLHYNKRVSFELKEVLREHFGQAQVRRLHDVLRLDVSRFLAKLDNPQKTLSYFEPEVGIVTVEAPKVYHVNLIFRYSISYLVAGKPEWRKVEYERIRMVINKKGIVRLETVLHRGQLGYEQELTQTPSAPTSRGARPGFIPGRPRVPLSGSGSPFVHSRGQKI